MKNIFLLLFFNGLSYVTLAWKTNIHIDHPKMVTDPTKKNALMGKKRLKKQTETQMGKLLYSWPHCLKKDK